MLGKGVGEYDWHVCGGVHKAQLKIVVNILGNKGVIRCLEIGNGTACRGEEIDGAHQIREKYPEVVVIDAGGNNGFGAGHNKVLPVLTSKYHVVINPDIILETDVITELSEYAEKLGNAKTPGSGRQEYLETVVNSIIFG